MKKIIFLGLVIIAANFGCNDAKLKTESVAEMKKDTIPEKSTRIYLDIDIAEQQENRAFIDQPISWRDFRANLLEFNRIRNATPIMQRARTNAVRYDIKQLVDYLIDLNDKNFDSVDVFLGKYVDVGTLPTGVSARHRGVFTIMFSAAGASETTTPAVKPYNVGNPWP